MMSDEEDEIWLHPDVAGRAEVRDSLLLTATIRRSSDPKFTVRARVRNVSETGMMAETPARPLSPGDAVEIDLRGIGQVTGAVVWYQDNRVGIRFDAPINPKAVRRPVGVRSGR